MATKVEQAARKMRIITEAQRGLEGLDGFAFGHAPRITKAPDCFWVQVWIKVPLDAAEEKKGK